MNWEVDESSVDQMSVDDLTWLLTFSLCHSWWFFDREIRFLSHLFVLYFAWLTENSLLSFFLRTTVVRWLSEMKASGFSFHACSVWFASSCTAKQFPGITVSVTSPSGTFLRFDGNVWREAQNIVAFLTPSRIMILSPFWSLNKEKGGLFSSWTNLSLLNLPYTY